MPPKPGTETGGNNAPADDVMSNINDMIDDDMDMYDDGAETDETDADAGDAGDADAGAASVSPPATGDGGEPELPMQLPRGQAPSQPQYDPENPRGYTRVGSLFADAQGNIVTRDGRIMAAKGEPARHWANMSRAAGQTTTLQRQNEALTRQIEGSKQLIESAKALVELPNKLGISKDEYNIGVQLIANWTRDPLATCRDMVARTMARGFNATDILGNDAGNAVEMTALRQLVNEATAGQRQREEMDRTVATQRQNAETAYNNFMGRYPDAAPHADAIAQLMNQRGMSAPEAYHELRYFALQEGLDFAYPLGPQLARKQQQPPVQQQPNGRTQRAPMVTGNGGGNRDHLTNEVVYADATATWGDILNSVMRQSA